MFSIVSLSPERDSSSFTDFTLLQTSVSPALHLKMSVFLTVPDPPGLLTISCRVPNHTYVRCSWVDAVDTSLPSEYTAFYR